MAKAFTHIQALRIITAGQPADTPGRLALAALSDHPEAVELVARLYDQFGFDTVGHSLERVVAQRAWATGVDGALAADAGRVGSKSDQGRLSGTA